MRASDAAKIIGANGKRRDRDFYPTPPECVYALMDFLNLPTATRFVDPACGDGAIIRALINRGYPNASGTDIIFGDDFLEWQDSEGADWIITNPPFFLAEQFIRKAHELNVPFAYLLKIQYWNSAKRRSLFKEIRPAYVLPLTWRPDFTGGGNSLMDMMWCVWERCDMDATFFLPLKKPEA